MKCIFKHIKTSTRVEGVSPFTQPVFITKVLFKCKTCGQERHRNLTNATSEEVSRAELPLRNIDCVVSE